MNDLVCICGRCTPGDTPYRCQTTSTTVPIEKAKDPYAYLMAYVMPDEHFKEYVKLVKAGKRDEAQKLFNQHAWSMVRTPHTIPIASHARKEKQMPIDFGNSYKNGDQVRAEMKQDRIKRTGSSYSDTQPAHDRDNNNKEKIMNNKPLRHGDISFHPVSKVPAGAKLVQHNGSFMAALGETTGHKHVIKAPELMSFEVWEAEDGRYIVVKDKVEINHQEHRTIKTWEPGIYKQEQELEEDAFQGVIRKVID